MADSIASPDSIGPLLDCLGPLLDKPGAFVYGSNDLFSPKPKNPARYLWRTSAGEHEEYVPDLPWEKLGGELAAAGWLDLNNHRGRLTVGGLDIALAGVHDPHADRDRYDLVAGPADPAARERRRRQVVAGAYPLRRAAQPQVTIAVMGALVPEALTAAERLEAAGVPADVVVVTSPGLLFRALRARQGLDSGTGEPTWILGQAFPADRALPLVTVLDGHPHTLAFLATINRVPHAALGVAQFGQSGAIEDLYRYNGIDADSIIRAALDLARP